jgi:hypothetical protein
VLALTPPATGGPAGRGTEPAPPPVDYSEAVRRYLDQAVLSPGSRRVYRISLTGWAWALVGLPRPGDGGRRLATPPVVPLAVLDDPATSHKLATALAERAATAGPRTVNRELSALRSAAGWWAWQGWITTDPTLALRNVTGPPPALPPLTGGQLARLFHAPPSLREHTFWRVLHDAAAPAEDVLRLDAGHLDLARHRARLPGAGAGDAAWIGWDCDTTRLMRWLLAGRPAGPVFVTGRRAPAGTAPVDVCPVTGRARLSYRRAAEIFAAATRPLDPSGRGWTLRQLRHATRPGTVAGLPGWRTSS